MLPMIRHRRIVSPCQRHGRVSVRMSQIPDPTTMNELKQKLTALGLSEEMAASVIQTVADFAKTKLPESLHGTLDDVLAGKSPDFGGLGGMLGSFFGK